MQTVLELQAQPEARLLPASARAKAGVGTSRGVAGNPSTCHAASPICSPEDWTRESWWGTRLLHFPAQCFIGKVTRELVNDPNTDSSLKVRL